MAKTKETPVWERGDRAYKRIHDHIWRLVVKKHGHPDEKTSTHKVLYQDLGIGKGEWSRKFRGFTKYSFDEIEWLRERLGAPPGWPLIDWDPPSMAAEPSPPTAAAPSAQPERRRRGGSRK